MAIIEPVKRNVENPQQIKKFSSGLRFWHWANVIIISGSLITVLINSTLMDRSTVVPAIKEEFEHSGLKATDQQLNGAAHALGDKVWEVHTYFGYFLAGMLLFRLILEFFQVTDQKFIRQLKNAYRQFNITKTNRQLALHELTVKSIYLVFYLLLIIMALTGLFLAFENALAAYRSYRHTVRNVHGFCMYLILAFIVVHLAGVFLAERKADGKGIVSDMINGGLE